ncbi:MAG: M43 family zinc metalloprotease [Chitinophagaceae bacterium]
MKTGLLLTLFGIVLTIQLGAQRNCLSFSYQQTELRNDPSAGARMNSIESFTRQSILSSQNNIAARTGSNIIKIPVVVHILYHLPDEKISDAQVQSQINALNKCFRRQHADSSNTPSRFKPVAADCEIEFQLANSDPRKRYTSGITRKYTPIQRWESNDKMKFSAEMGDDAWDPKSYLNIWVCNLEQVAGYSSMMGGAENKDGVVIGFSAFGTNNSGSGYNMGKTAVHEVGHWLGLKHLWGDTDCGDDGVADTPRQAWYNIECPSGIQISCNNGQNGDMYMNYMDFTSDACMNLFTLGQKARMRALFEKGAVRNPLLTSKGLNAPMIFESPLPEDDPKWLQPRLFPNPAISELQIDLSYDIRWVGKTIFITNLNGQSVMNVAITSKIQRIDISKLKPGLYFLAAKKDDGESMKQKFIKL